jgi:hypothetical protein
MGTDTWHKFVHQKYSLGNGESCSVQRVASSYMQNPRSTTAQYSIARYIKYQQQKIATILFVWQQGTADKTCNMMLKSCLQKFLSLRSVHEYRSNSLLLVLDVDNWRLVLFRELWELQPWVAEVFLLKMSFPNFEMCTNVLWKWPVVLG